VVTARVVGTAAGVVEVVVDVDVLDVVLVDVEVVLVEVDVLLVLELVELVELVDDVLVDDVLVVVWAPAAPAHRKTVNATTKTPTTRIALPSALRP
jgi:hypothetical protein